MGEKGNMAAGSGWPAAGNGGTDVKGDLSDFKGPGSSGPGGPRLSDAKGPVTPDAGFPAGAADRDAGIPGPPGLGSPPAPGSVGPLSEPPGPGGTAFGGAVLGGRRDREAPPEAGARGNGR